jgi:hypothetical protein
MKTLLENVNGIAGLGGFLVLELGIATEWSLPIAAIAGGSLVMASAAWPYLVRMLRRNR